MAFAFLTNESIFLIEAPVRTEKARRSPGCLRCTRISFSSSILASNNLILYSLGICLAAEIKDKGNVGEDTAFSQLPEDC